MCFERFVIIRRGVAKVLDLAIDPDQEYAFVYYFTLRVTGVKTQKLTSAKKFYFDLSGW